MAKRCKALNASGGPCSAVPLPDQDWCIWHDPDRKAERDEVRRRGGLARSNVMRARKKLPPALTPDELNRTLSVLLTDVIAGVVDTGVASAAATLIRASLGIRTQIDVEERLAALEAAAGVKGRVA